MRTSLARRAARWAVASGGALAAMCAAYGAPDAADDAADPAAVVSANAPDARPAATHAAAGQREPAAQAPTPAAQPMPATAAGMPSPRLRYGINRSFRGLIPSPQLELLTDAEYRQIVQSAARSQRLLAPDDARVKRLRAIVARLAPNAVKWSDRVKDWRWEVNAIDTREVRAACLPGGKVLASSGLVDRLRLTDDELGVLFAHEIAHALREHVRERLGEQQTAQFGAHPLPSLLGLTEPLPAPLELGERLASMRYSATDETEADVIGGDIAARSGFDPRAALTLWRKLAAATRADQDTGFIYAHPYDASRRRDQTKRLADLMPLYAKAIGKRLDTLPDYAGISAKRPVQAGR